jgi:diguanylate cyclase (GGDEF)-like protein
LRISASVGVAMAPEHANNPNTLMRAADEAMYVAKRKGKNAWSMATPPVMPNQVAA